MTGSGQKVVVIGAGPTGLGAAHRLRELGHEDVVVLEATDRVGGLATSFTDDAGFTYDIGGHVMFSHYPYYDQLVDRLMGDDYTELRREAWVWMEGRYVPYPLQNNLRHLTPESTYACVMGLIEAGAREATTPESFRDWVLQVFGEGIAERFMFPYNFKVWATPPELMNHVWIGERVSVVDVGAVLKNVILGEDERSWGPNSTFRYPLRGGTGHLWNRLAEGIDDLIQRCSPVVQVDLDRQVVTTAAGTEVPYDVLLSTIRLDHLVQRTLDVPQAVSEAVGGLERSGSLIVGVALDRPTDTSKNWVYFPEPDVPFYRVTYLSNYSPYICPRPDQTVLLTETSWSRHKPEDPTTIVDRVIDGLVSTGLMSHDDRSRIVSTWLCRPEASYPVPSLGRDAALGTIQPWLRSHNVWSRGRFGAWLYEIGNMDHSTMQGVEFADHVIDGTPEATWIPRGQELRA